jgi:hypothetical protein
MKELIRKILNEETNQGKYISALEDLTEEFKNEDCVCDIKIECLRSLFNIRRKKRWLLMQIIINSEKNASNC